MKVLKIGDIDVLLDDWDWLCLCRYKWRVKSNGYSHISIARTERRKGIHRTIYMHRKIMNTPKILHCHHKISYGNAIDNRKENLQNLTKAEHNVAIEEYFESWKHIDRQDKEIPF